MKHTPELIVDVMREGWLLAQSTKHEDGYLYKLVDDRKTHNNDIGSIGSRTIKKLNTAGLIRRTETTKDRIYYELVEAA